MEHPRKLPEVDERLFGKCCFCAKPITPASFERQEVVAAFAPGVSVLMCAVHVFTADGRGEAETYHEALEILAKECGLNGITNIVDTVKHYPRRK